MEHIIMDSFQLTIVAMSLVFVVLTGLMFLMQLTAKLVDGLSNKKVDVETNVKEDSPQLEIDEKLKKIALLAALAKNTEDKSGKHFRVEKIERIK